MDVRQSLKFDTTYVVLIVILKPQGNCNMFDINNNLSKLVKDWINKFSEVTLTNWIQYIVKL